MLAIPFNQVCNTTFFGIDGGVFLNFTIIIPHYNSPTLLSRLLESIGYFEDTEIIVIDDKSNLYLDEYNECVKKYSYYVNFNANTTEKKGAGVCRNIGLQMAKGEWLLFADSDDVFDQNWHKLLSLELTSKYDIIYYFPSAIVPNIPSRVLELQQLIIDATDNRDNIDKLKYSFNPPWSKMINIRLIKKYNIKFDETIYANDAMFSVKCAYYASSIEVKQEVFYLLDEVPESLTKQNNFNSYKIRIEVVCQIYRFLSTKINKKLLNRLYIVNVPLKSIIVCLKNRYGYKSISTLLKLYKKYDFPIINLNYFITKILFKKFFHRK